MHDSGDELEVIDLVHSGVDAFEGVHGSGHVAGDGHTETVRLGADGFVPGRTWK